MAAWSHGYIVRKTGVGNAREGIKFLQRTIAPSNYMGEVNFSARNSKKIFIPTSARTEVCYPSNPTTSSKEEIL